MIKLTELFLAELKRSWILLLRYATEALGGIVITTTVFYGLFLSARYIAGPTSQFGDRLDAIIVGYVLWTLTLFIINDVASRLQEEALSGTLEQIFLSPYPPTQIFLLRACASLSLQSVLIVSILLIILWLTNSQLAFPLLLILPLICVLLGAYGLAFAMGGLALIFKRVGQLLGIAQFGLLFLLSVPLETEGVGLPGLQALLPMTMGAGLLRNLMARQTGLDWGTLGLALINGLAYLALGLWLFRQAERLTKRRGRLGGY